ncbi:MAG TPA: hypothetical protein VE085_08505 [Burkholderiales bacterium]|nr:hypothetical protein [Burkholderiales bacterium]
MNAAIVAHTLSLIPDRVARVQSGSTFDPVASACCAHPERITHLARFMNWLGPLHPVTKDDLRILGLMTPSGKPAIAVAEEPDEELDALADEAQEIVLEPQPVVEPQSEARLT